MSKEDWQIVMDAIKSLWILAMAEGDEQTAKLAERAEDIHLRSKPE